MRGGYVRGVAWEAVQGEELRGGGCGSRGGTVREGVVSGHFLVHLCVSHISVDVDCTELRLTHYIEVEWA